MHFTLLKQSSLSIFLLLITLSTNAQNYLMGNLGTISTCAGTFYDSGGSGAAYTNNQNYTVTFCSSSGLPIYFQFSQFVLENSFDYLYIYNGPTTGSPLIGTYSGTNNPGTVVSSNASNCLTFRFTSDVSITYAGWTAAIGCGTPPPPPPPSSGTTCAVSQPFCSGTSYNFPAATNTTAEIGPAYGCLLTQPNPVWYYLQIANPGNLDITLSNTSSVDVDFVCWGPFSSSSSCASLTTGNIVDCSYSTAAVENINIAGAQTGQYYILCITNFANATTNFTLSTDPTSTASTNCAILCNITAMTAVPGACNPVDNTHVITGALTVQYPPSTGTLTITTSTGQSVVLNGPFTSPVNYTIPGINSNGGTVTVNAQFSSDTSCHFSRTYTAPAACTCTVTASNNSPACVGANVTLSASITGTPISYQWAGPNGYTSSLQNPVINNATINQSGTYTVTVMFAASCTATATTNVVITTTPVAAITPASATICNGQSTTLTASGGINYAWSNGVNTDINTVSPTNSTTYTVTVTSNGCSATASRTVTVNNNPIAAINPSSVTICNGQSTTLTASGAANFSWSNAATTAAITVSPTTTTTYTVTVTDANTCTATASRLVNVNSNPVASITPSSTAVCIGQSTSLTASGGASYLWGNNATTSVISVTLLSSANFTVTVTDANTCTATASASVTVNALPVASINPSNVTICNGQSATLTASGAANFNWSNAATTAAITVSPATTTTYSVTVTDANTCTATASRTVNVNSNPVAAINPTAVSICNGQSTSLTASGALNYTWSNSATTTTISVSPSTTTTYTVTATNTNLCTATASSVVTVNNNPIASINPNTTSICSGNTAIFTAGGGTSYSWSNSGTTASINVSPVNNTTYSVTVTDANLCTATASASLIVNALPTLSINPANVSLCSGQSTTLTATGAVLYTWSNGVNATSITVSPSTSTTYTVSAVDANACTATASRQVVVNNNPIAQINPVSTVVCSGNSTTLTASGGVNYNWSNGAGTNANATISPANTTTYSVTATDANSCTGSATAVVNVIPGINLSSTQLNVICYGGNTGSIDLNVNGGQSPFSYSWSNNIYTEDNSNLTAGLYSVTVSDGLGCSAVGTNTITEPTPITLVESHTNVLCHGDNSGSITITANGSTGPYTYVWNDGITSQNRTNVIAGLYNVTCFSSANCSATLSVSISEPSPLSFTETHIDAICFNTQTGSVNLTINGATLPYNFLWNDGLLTEDRNNIGAGIYSVTITDFHACSISGSITIAEPSQLTVSETHTDVTCNSGNNGTIDISVTGATPPYTYIWNDAASDEDRIGIAAASYAVSVSDFNQCSSSIGVNVNQPSAVVLSEIHTNVSCNAGQDATINITTVGGVAPYTYTWNDGFQTEDRTGLLFGNYSVTTTDANYCNASISIGIVQPTPVSITGTIRNASCKGYSDGSILATATGGTTPYTYTWTTNSQSPLTSGLALGSYTVTVFDNNLCTAQGTYFVGEPTSLVSSPVLVNPTCLMNGNDGSIELNISGGTPPYQYDWGSSLALVIPNQLGPGTYAVTVTDANNCSITSTHTLSYLYDFTVQASPDVSIDFGESTTLDYTVSGTIGNYVNMWSPSVTLSCIDCASPVSTPIVSTRYFIEVVNDAGCKASDFVNVTVVPNYDIFIPNVFTPNGDGNNDLFQIFGNLNKLAFLQVQIFNRWGEKVFESSDHHFKWDGTYRGEAISPQVLVWQLRLVFLDGHREELRKGTITLAK